MTAATAQDAVEHYLAQVPDLRSDFAYGPDGQTYAIKFRDRPWYDDEVGDSEPQRIDPDVAAHARFMRNS